MPAWIRETVTGGGPARPARGVTLVELCFALFLVALLAALAAPGFRLALRTVAVRAATFELMAGLQRTRAESILRARPAQLCPTTPAGTCRAASAPASAWQARLDTGDADRLAGADLPRGVSVRATRSPLRFWPHSLSASTGTLTICDDQDIAAPRAIIVSQTGRARLAAARRDACRA